jgi:hypothetical protein
MIKMARSKSEFEWKSQQQIGVVEVTEKEKRLISLCSLDITDQETEEVEERWYISISNLKYFKNQWNPVKGYTIPLDNWQQIRDIIESNIEWE